MIVTSLLESIPALAIGFAGGWEFLIIGGIALLLFGNRLPGAAKSLGQSFSAFKKGLKDSEDDVGELPQPPEQGESKS